MKIPTISSLVLLIVLCTGLSEVKAAATRTPYTTTESTTAATLKDTGGVTVYYGRRSAEFQLRFAVQAIKDKCQDKCNALKDELEDEEDDRDRYCNAFDDYADCLQNTDKCYGSEDWIENVILRCGIGSQKVSSRGPPELIIRTGVAAVYAKCSPTCSNEYTRVDLAKDHKDLYCEAFATYGKCVKDSGCKVSQRTIDDILEHCKSTTAAILKDTGGVTVYYGRRYAEFQLKFAVQAVKDKCQDKCNALKDDLEDEEDDRDRYCNAFDDYADCLQNKDKCYGSEDGIDIVKLRCGIGSQKVSGRGPPELIIRTGVAAVYAKCSPSCSNEYTRVDLAKDHKDLYCEAFATYGKCVKDKGCKVSQRTIDDILEHCNPSTTSTTDTSTDFSLRYAAHQLKARCGNKCLYEWQEKVKQEQDRGEYCSAFDQYAVCLQQTDVCFGANRLITKVQDLCRNGLSGFLTENKGAAGVDIREATERIHMKCPRACSNKYDLMRDVRNNKKEYCMAFVRYSDCLKDDWLCFVRQTAMDYVLDLCNADKGTE